MVTEVVMPQMGESVAEGTIVRWIKQVGDTVERDEPLFEISTDKVDAEVPSPVAGVIIEIRAKEGETVDVHSVVAVIGPAGSMPASPLESPQSTTPVAPPAVAALSAAAPRDQEESVRHRSSPLVRRIAKEHNIDITQIRGSGISGRVTKNDMLSFLDRSGALATVAAGSAGGAGEPARVPDVGLAGQTVPMSVMRRRIAEHMVASRRTSAHVHTVFEVDFGRVEKVRQAKKAEYERAGAKLTYLPFILKATADALRAVPVINASLDGDNIVYHKEINIGVAVALDRGLIVPVVKNVAEKDLLGLSRLVADLAIRARNKQLKPDDVSGGTFTVTNPGVSGALFGMPIINQPQVAILGVGAVERRPVVIDDSIAIRPMAYLALGFDHRIIDGAVADEFMSHLKHALEHWDPLQA